MQQARQQRSQVTWEMHEARLLAHLAALDGAKDAPTIMWMELIQATLELMREEMRDGSAKRRTAQELKATPEWSPASEVLDAERDSRRQPGSSGSGDEHEPDQHSG